ncbi:MAG: T9SS type A sorting domain-containing protein [Bacteroidota bacterium]|nr:T9SS type A sorting domain-containing protein [Bacteroidota bacterium]
MKNFLSILLMLVLVQTNAQIPVGAWRDHLPYAYCRKVVKAGTKVYCATPNNLFVYSTKDNSIEKLSKITGLSDMGISTVEYNFDKDVLLIAYTNGNIDLLKKGGITNIPSVLNQSMTGSKKANHIFFRGNYAYISYPFGIVVLDIVKNEIKDTYPVGEQGTTYEVFSLVADNDYFYAATAKGIFKASVNNQYLVDYSQWKRDLTIPNSTGKFNLLGLYNNKVITNYTGGGAQNDTLYYLENNSWKRFLADQNQLHFEIRQCNSQLLITANYRIFVLNSNMALQETITGYGFNNADPYSSLIDDNGVTWIADNGSSLVYKGANTSEYHTIAPNGPNSEHVRNMAYSNGIVYATGGGLNVSWNNLFYHGELFMFNNDTWSSIYNQNAFDYIAVKPDPSNAGKVYAGAWGTGVWGYENGKNTENFTDRNSTLQTNIPGKPYVRVGGITFDSDHNMWMTNNEAASPISVRKNDGTWKSFALGSYINSPVISDILQDAYGQFWIVLPRGTGMFVFNPKGTIDNENDDAYLKFKPVSIYGNTISNIFCEAIDRDGYIWVGTDQGPVLYTNPQDVLNGSTAGTQVTIPRNDGTSTVDPLLGAESINCIAIDGGNRKWFGTEKGGAFLMSADGTKEIYHFNTDNSPIFSNTVRAITINDQTGEVFFGTDKGIISFRDIATAPAQTYSDIYVYPNPVRDSYAGDIIISGLVENSTIKITDISGNLVYHTKSVGGQARWNGKTGSGRRVATGVYLVFCSNDDGSQTKVSKLLVIH